MSLKNHIKAALFHPFLMLQSFFDSDAHKIVSKRGLEILNEMKEGKQLRIIDDVSRYRDFMSVGDLKKFLAENPDIPDNAKVLVQRVEDVYYEKHSWGVVLKKGHHYYMEEEHNKKMQREVERRASGKEPHYSIEDPSKAIIELDESAMEQYHPAWCCLKYEDDNNLYIDLHY
jgi:hypothetical protein